MDNDAKKKLLDELAKQMSGNTTEEPEKGQLISKIDSSTNTVTFMLSGTKYNIEDMQKARKYLQEKLSKHPNERSDRRMYYEIAVTCIDAIIHQYTKPVDSILGGK